MKKIKSILKKYKKVLIGSLVGILIVTIVTSVMMIFNTISTVLQNNETQMENVIRMVDNTRDYNNIITDLDHQNSFQKLGIISNLLRMEPGDAANEAVMEGFGMFQASQGFFLIDKKRNVVYSYDDDLLVDFKDSRFDSLFETDDFEEAAVLEADRAGGLYYCSVFNGKYYLVSADVRIDDETASANTFKNAWAGGISTLAVADGLTGEIIASSDEKIEGEKLNIGNIRSNLLCKIDRDYFGQVAFHEDKGIYLLALTPIELIVEKAFGDIQVEIGLLFIAVCLLIAFAIILREDEIDPSKETKWRKRYYIKPHLKRFAALAVVAGVSIGAISFLLVSLNDATTSGEYLTNEAMACKQLIDGYKEEMQIVDQMSEYVYLNYGMLLDYFLKVHPDHISKDGLRELADIFQAKDITLFDAEGNTVCTSSPLDHLSIMEDTESSLYDLRYVLTGKQIEVVPADENKMDGQDLVYAVAAHDECGIADGAIAIIVDKDRKNGILDYENLGVEYNPLKKDQKSTLIVVDADANIVYSGEENLIGMPLDDIGLSTDILQDGYFKETMINGENCLVLVAQNTDGSGYQILIEPFSWISVSSVQVIILEILFYPWLALWILVNGLGNREHFKEKRLKKHSTNSDTGSDSNEKISWSELTSGKKLMRIIRVLVSLFSIYLIIYYLMVKNGNANTAGLGYVLFGAWDKSFNTFAIVANLCLFCVISSIIRWVGIVLRIASNISGQGGVTILRLIASLMKYIGVVAAFYLAAINFGIDANTTLASLGIVGFGLTFGAQDIIKDFIAGIFILFEGNYKVGDLLSINGESYFVKAVGVRTTKVEAWGKVKVINNSQMTGVINIQNSVSSVNCDVQISNEHDLEEIEKIMKAELPQLKANYPEGCSAPMYQGVKEFDGNGVVLRFRVFCPPLLQSKVGLILSRDIKLLMDKHHVNLPVTAYDIHYVNDTKKTEL